jgi:hypothetical protein
VRRLAAALACALAASLGGAPAWACDPGGIGGTGIDPGGIGGTGQRAEAELGVLGVITGFASICVNGIEVHYDAATPVSMNGQPASAGALGVGQVVAVRAVGSGTQARAREIDIVDAAVGPVTAVEIAGELLQVQGRRVRVGASTVLGGGLSREQLAAAQPGARMRVSGLSDANGVIVATRLEPAAPGARPAAADPAEPSAARFLVQGYVADVQPQTLRVGATTFGVAPELGSQLSRGQLVRLAGRTEAGNRIVERADFLRSPFDIRPERTLRTEPRAPRGSDERRSGRDGGESDRSGRGGGDIDRSGRGGGDIDRSGRSGPDRVERVERPDRSGRSERVERPERPDRSGSNSGRN